jgi:hypothetical protein
LHLPSLLFCLFVRLARLYQVRESLRCGLVSRDAAHQLVRLVVTPVLPPEGDHAAEQVFDFLLDSGWIATLASHGAPTATVARAAGSSAAGAAAGSAAGSSAAAAASAPAVPAAAAAPSPGLMDETRDRGAAAALASAGV